MSPTPYDILPPERDWTADVERLAVSIVNGTDRRDDHAALSLLFRAPGDVWMHQTVRCYIQADLRGHVRVLWSRLYLRALDREIPGATDEQRAAILLACSMANALCPVRLGDVLGHLTEPTRRAFVDAMAYLVGK